MNALNRAITAAAVAACFLVMVGCQQATAPDSRSAVAAQQDISDLHSALLKGYNSKDAAAIAALYSDDAILMPPNLAPVKSKIAVGDFMRQMLVPPYGSMLLNVAETVVSGDYAFSSGFYTVLRTDGTTLDNGKFVEVLKNESGSWHIYRDIYNSDMAAATMAPSAATH
ncbi:MAG: YybH family protein [Gammaproteobacteria bacterium]